jgi:hypothetical protein
MRHQALRSAAAKTRTAATSDRQKAYNIAKSLKADKSGDWGVELNKAAQRYFDLEDRSGSQEDRIKAAQWVIKELREDLKAAQNLIKVINNHQDVFRKALAEHQKLAKESSK